MRSKSDTIYLKGPSGCLAIYSDDNVGKKIAMLIENKCLGVKVTDVAKKYGFSRSRFYQVKDVFETGGVEALIEKKRGPKRNYVRTETINNQIIRHRFLDPDASAEVIAQKMRQAGYNISIRSVERTITEFGLQKKKSIV
jgi:transposase